MALAWSNTSPFQKLIQHYFFLNLYLHFTFSGIQKLVISKRGSCRDSSISYKFSKFFDQLKSNTIWLKLGGREIQEFRGNRRVRLVLKLHIDMGMSYCLHESLGSLSYQIVCRALVSVFHQIIRIIAQNCSEYQISELIQNAWESARYMPVSL